MKKIVIGTLAALALVGCGQGTVDDARAGLPEIGDVTIPLPGDSTASGQGGLVQQPLGQKAEMYEVTRAVTGVVNLGVVWALGTVRFIASLPPTSHVGNTFTWGPSTPRNLEPKNNFKLEVTKNADGSVSYDLSGKKTDEDDTKWRSLMSGTHQKGAVARSGKGTFHVDWNAARELNDPKDTVGSAVVTYGFAAGTGYTIDVEFKQVKDGNSGKLVDATYHFAQPTEGNGSFEFSTAKDLGNDGVAENLVVRSRWMTSGRGRSDVRASGGSLAAPATGSECWGDDFDRTFVERSWDPARDEGKESDCAFSTAEFPNL